MTDTVLDLAGIGIGPFNMSVAAHLDSLPEVKAAFFDRRPTFNWHPGLMLPGAELQNSYLKDLVTAANPTSPWSFMAYLVRHKRFYKFLNCEFDAVYRKETAAYFKWVASSLPSLNFGHEAEQVSFEKDRFTVRFANGSSVQARSLSVGVGTTPSVPDCAAPWLSDTCFHASEIVFRKNALRGKKVAIIGGGQSGCEVFLDLINGAVDDQDRVLWFSRRPNFEPLDASAFTNEYFTPEYSDRFHPLPAALKTLKLAQQKLASDGASPSTLLAIYRRLYELTYLDGCQADLRLMPNREVVAIERQGNSYALTVRNHFDEQLATYHVEAIVLATGYATRTPACLDGLKGRMQFEGPDRYALNADYSVIWDGPASNRIYAVNASRHSHGIADPQMSIAAWRGATIVNSLLGRMHFDLELPPSLVRWGTEDGDTPAALIAEAAE